MARLRNNAYYDRDSGGVIFMRDGKYYAMYHDKEYGYDTARSIEEAISLFKQTKWLYGIFHDATNH